MESEAHEVTSNLDNVEETMVEMEDEDEEEEGEEEEEREEGGGEGVVKKKKRAAAKKDDGAAPDYKVPDVEKIVLNEDIQNSLGVLVGIDVTGENPWKIVNKERLTDNIASLGNRSPFAPFKKQLKKYEEEDILIGYILDETNDEDEFYLCLTPTAKEYCERVSDEFLKRQAQKLDESVVKEPGEWISLGTEKELDETIVKNSRPLIRIDIKSKFPILSQTDRFKERNANDVRDGYIELIPVKQVTDNLQKKRIDAEVQVTPVVQTNSAQTVPRFPRNMWTQCTKEDANKITDQSAEEDPDEPPVELSDHEKHKREVAAKLAEKERELTVLRFRDFLYDKVPIVERVMDFNSTIDIYNLDYPDLVANKELCKVENLDLKELLVFSDKRTKNLFVATVKWHPLYTQFVAVSYIDSVPNVITKHDIQKVDEVKRIIYEVNPVLVWSVFDSLKPKYYFEANSGVSALSICIFDEDLFIGGCLNGQIVLWDAKVMSEEEITEVLSDEEESNRQMLYSGMTWMKKIHDRYILRTTVTSDLRNSHNSVVTDITWVSSHYEFNSFGKLTKLPKDAPKSKQFLSSSQDGSILIWDLKIPKDATVSDVLKTKHGLDVPKVLIFEKSPYKVLKGRFKPIFRINTGVVETRRLLPLLLMTTEYPNVNKLVEKIDKKGHRTVCELEDEPAEGDEVTEGEPKVGPPILCLCTLHGEYIRISWGGSGAGPKDTINSSTSTFVSRSEFHDGIIVACTKNTFFNDIVATIGGKIIAIWKGETQNKPIAWKYMSYSLKGASWSKKIPSQIYILTDTGHIDIWDFLERSDMPVRSQILTGTYSTGIYPHMLYDKYIMSIADHSASVSIYSIPNTFSKCNENDLELVKKVFDREQDVRERYIQWSETWYASNPATHNRYVKVIVKEEQPEKPFTPIAEADDGFGIPKTTEKLPPSLQRVAAFHRRWKQIQSEGVELAIQVRKALNKAELLFYEKPLRDVEAQKRSKRRKMLDALENRNKIFEESLEILFPEAVPEDPPLPYIKPYELVMEQRRKILSQYEKQRKKSKNIVRKNPYEYSFSWGNEICQGKDRSRNLDERARIFAILNEKINEQVVNPPEFRVVEIEEEVVESKQEVPEDEGEEGAQGDEGEEGEDDLEEMPVVEEKPKPRKKPDLPSLPPSPVLSDVDSESD